MLLVYGSNKSDRVRHPLSPRFGLVAFVGDHREGHAQIVSAPKANAGAVTTNISAPDSVIVTRAHNAE